MYIIGSFAYVPIVCDTFMMYVSIEGPVGT